MLASDIFWNVTAKVHQAGGEFDGKPTLKRAAMVGFHKAIMATEKLLTGHGL